MQARAHRIRSIADEPALRFEGTGLLRLGVAYQSPKIDALRVAHGAVAEEVRALSPEYAQNPINHRMTLPWHLPNLHGHPQKPRAPLHF